MGAMEKGQLRNPPGKEERLATRVAFFINGLGMAAWAPLVPFAKARLSVDDGTFGAILLCLGAGSLVSMPFAGALAARIGCRRAISIAALLICVPLPLLATASTPMMLALGLFLFGAGGGLIDVVGNIHAIIVEKAAGRPLMSGFHGLFSAGGIAGASGVSVLLGMGANPQSAALIVGTTGLLLIGIFGRRLLPYAESGEHKSFVIPRGTILLIALLIFLIYLAEGAMLDWSAIFLTTEKQAGAESGGFAYAAFASAMTIGRLTGDRIVQHCGERRILILGSLCSTAGLLLVTILPTWKLCLIGFAFVGIGASNIVPVFYTLLGKQRIMPVNLAVSSVTTLGYMGILAGPALIGFASNAANLSVAFGIVGASLILITISANYVLRGVASDR